MSISEKFIEKWKNDYDFKTVTTALVSFAVTVVFALYNGFLGICHSSLWHGTICVYYIILACLRGLIINTVRKYSRDEKRDETRKKVYIIVSGLLFILNSSLVVPIIIMIRQENPVNMTKIPAIAMAVYTVYKAIMASVNFRKKNRSALSLVRLLRSINFIDALVSILTLQYTLIMVNSTGEDIGSMRTLMIFTSTVIWIAILFLSVLAIINGIRGVKSKT